MVNTIFVTIVSSDIYFSGVLYLVATLVNSLYILKMAQTALNEIADPQRECQGPENVTSYEFLGKKDLNV